MDPIRQHEHALNHALELLPASAIPLAQLAMLAVAQHWSANTRMLCVLAPRSLRTHWKYRNHVRATA